MGAYRQRGLGKDLLECLLFVDQQIAGARADKDFDARNILRFVQLGNVAARRTDIKAVIGD